MQEYSCWFWSGIGTAGIFYDEGFAMQDYSVVVMQEYSVVANH